MLTGGTDPLYRDLLAMAPRPLAYLQVWRSGVRIDTTGAAGLPFFDGAVTATLNSQVTRQLTFSIDESYWPATDDPTELLNPFGNEVRAWRGVYAGAGIPYAWEIFRGRLDEISLQVNGEVTVHCVDRAAQIKDAGFIFPENSQAGTQVTNEFRRLIGDAIISPTFGTFDDIRTLTPPLTWEQDRAAACDDLSNAAGAFWYALANGDFVIRFVPWTVNQASVMTFTDGEGGALTSAVPGKSRANVFNQVTVTGERSDGGAAVFATAQDLNPASPTYVNGPFGVKSKLLNLQGVQTQSQALSIAKTALKQARSLTQQWDIAMIPDASLELGDAITIQARGLAPITQVVTGFTLPLLDEQSMDVQLRALQLGQDVGSTG